MSAGLPVPPKPGVPIEENANERQNDRVAEPLGLGRATDADRTIAELKRVLLTAGNSSGQMEALATLQRQPFDPGLNSASSQQAGALVRTLEPNGWDEV